MHKHIIYLSTFIKGGVQWKQAVVIYMMSYTSSLHNTTPMHCTPLPLHPPLPSIQLKGDTYIYIYIYICVCVCIYIYIYI